MKIEKSTAPGAATYSARWCSREPRTAPRAVRIPDYSAPCGSQGYFEAARTAPRADLISITRRSPFSYVPLHRFAAVAPPLLLPTLRALPAVRRLHPSRTPLVAPFAMSQIAPFNLAGRALSTGDTTSRVTNQAGVTTTASAAGMQRAHPVHQVHHSTASRSPHAGKTVRDHAWTVRDGGRSKVETPPRPDRAPSLFFAPSKLDFENEDHE